MKLKKSPFLSSLALVVLAASTAFGQGSVGKLDAGNVEVAAFGGLAAGVGRTAAGVGGNIAVAATRVIMPYFETTYFPDLTNVSVTQAFNTNITLPNNQVLTTSGTGTLQSSFTDFHGGVHLRIPTKANPSLVPYFAFGVGALRRSQADVIYKIGQPTLPAGVTIPPAVLAAALADRTDTFPSDTQLAVNFGGGIRYYATENFGVRVEAKVYKPTGEIIGRTSDPFFKLTFGVFYYFK
jgi:hypothetical protein